MAPRTSVTSIDATNKLSTIIREETQYAIPDDWALREMIRRMVVADIKARIRHGIKTELDDLLTR